LFINVLQSFLFATIIGFVAIIFQLFKTELQNILI
jgi:hypothetical protein